MVTSCGVLVLNRESELLLGHATAAAHWDIPKGVGEPDETPLATALREASEETGLHFDGEALLDLGRFAYRPGKDLHLFATLVERFDLACCTCASTFRDARGRLRPEFDGYEWAPFARVPQRCARSMSAVLTERLSLPGLLQRLRCAGP